MSKDQNTITFGNNQSYGITIPIVERKIILEIYLRILCYGLNKDKSSSAVLKELETFEAIWNLRAFLELLDKENSGLLGEAESLEAHQELAFKIYKNGYIKAFPNGRIEAEVMQEMERLFPAHHPVMQVIKYLLSVGRPQGMREIYQDTALRHQFDQTFLSVDERKQLTENQFLIKTLRPEVVADFWKQIKDYGYRAKLRSLSSKETSHKLSLRKGVIKVNVSKKKKEDKKYIRTKKQSATLLSHHLQTPFFNRSNVGLLFDLPSCKLKASMMYDTSTFERSWHGSEKEVKAWRGMMESHPTTQEKTLYYTKEFEAFKARINDPANVRLNEVLAEFSENSIRGIFLGRKEKYSNGLYLPKWNKLGLYEALLLRYEYYVNFGRELPIYYYCSRNKIFRKLSRYEIEVAYIAEVSSCGSRFTNVLNEIIREDPSGNLSTYLFNGGGLPVDKLTEIFCFSLAFSTVGITRKIFDETLKYRSEATIKDFLANFVMKCLVKNGSSPADILSKFIVFDKNKEILGKILDKMVTLQMWDSLSDFMLFINNQTIFDTIYSKVNQFTQIKQERKVNEAYWECYFNASFSSLQQFRSVLDALFNINNQKAVNRILSGEISGVSLLRKLVKFESESNKGMLEYYLSKLDSEPKKKNFLEMIEKEVDNESFFLYLCDKKTEQFDLILKKYFEVKGGDAFTDYFFNNSYSHLYNAWKKPLIYKIYRKNPDAFDRIFFYIRQAPYEVRKKAIFDFIETLIRRKRILHANPASVKLVIKLWETVLPADRQAWFEQLYHKELLFQQDAKMRAGGTAPSFRSDWLFITGKWGDTQTFLNFLSEDLQLGPGVSELRIFLLIDHCSLRLSLSFKGLGILQFLPDSLEDQMKLFKLRSKRTKQTCLEKLLCCADKQVRERLFQLLSLDDILSIIFPDGLNPVAIANFFCYIQQSPSVCLQLLELIKKENLALYEKEIICPKMYRIFFNFGNDLHEPDLREKISDFKKDFSKPEFAASYVEDMIENPIMSIPESGQAMISAFLNKADITQSEAFFNKLKERIETYPEKETNDIILHNFRSFLSSLENANKQLEKKPYSNQITQCRNALFRLWVTHLCRQEKNYLEEWQRGDNTGTYFYPELRKAYIKAKFERLDKQEDAVKYASPLYWIFFKESVLNAEASLRSHLAEKNFSSYVLFAETFSTEDNKGLSKEKLEKLQNRLCERIEKNYDYLRSLLPEKNLSCEVKLNLFRQNPTLSHATALAEALKTDLATLENDKRCEVSGVGVVLDTLFCALLIPIIVKLLYYALSSKPVGFFGKTKTTVLVENLSDLANKLSLPSAQSGTRPDSQVSP